MSRYLRGNDLAQEFLNLAQNLERNSFQAVSIGIGLGTLRPHVKMPQHSPAVEPMLPQLPNDFPQHHVAQKPVSNKTYRVPTIGIWRRIPGFFLVHFGDLLIVSSSTALAIFLAVIAFAPQMLRAPMAEILAWEPVNFLLHLRSWQILAAVYFGYGVYWVFFRIFVGATIAKLLLRSETATIENS